MNQENNEKRASRLAELEEEFKKGETLVKALQEEIAERQRKVAVIRETQLRLQGAFAELKHQEEELKKVDE